MIQKLNDMYKRVAISQNKTSCGPYLPKKTFNIEKCIEDKDTNLSAFGKQ